MSLADGVKLPDPLPRQAWPGWAVANSRRALATLLRPPRAGCRPIRRAYARLAVGALIAVAVLALAMLYLDGPVALAAKQAPRWLDLTFQKITDFGKSGWFLYPLGIALLALSTIASPALSRTSQAVLAVLSTRLGFLFLAIAAPSLVVTIVKRIIGRARPYVGSVPDPHHFVAFGWRSEFASMPSGHTTTAFAAAAAFGILWPSLRPLLLVYAVAVAVSRVMVHAHFVSDVVAGAIVGVIGAVLVRDWFAARHLGFVIDREGRVQALPGPSLMRIKKVARERIGT